MIDIDKIQIGEVIQCGSGKAIVTSIDGDKIFILHEWGEIDSLEKEHYKYWNSTGIISKT